jgi:hypothetical protein
MGVASQLLAESKRYFIRAARTDGVEANEKLEEGA